MTPQTKPVCRKGDDALKDALARRMVHTYLQRIEVALSDVHQSALPDFKKRSLTGDLKRKRALIKAAVGDGFNSAAHVLGTVGPNLHGPGIEMVLRDVARALGALSERRAA